MARTRWLAPVVAAIVGGSACSYHVELPTLERGAATSRVLAADGSTLARLHAERDRVPVAFEDVPGHLVDAVIAIEDSRFWEHGAVDVRSIGRALVENVRSGDVAQGGSTITQQYVKNTMTSGDETIRRKVREAVLARELEKRLSKREILERYLNEIYLGNGAYGIGAAARFYFSKPVAELTLAESALLAGIIRAPERYDPADHPDRAHRRRSTVLVRMADLGLTTRADAYLAAVSPLELRQPPDRYRAPYFVDEVVRFILGDERFGATVADRRRALYKGGLRIETTLDPRIQRAAEAAVGFFLGDPRLPDAAVAVVEPRNGNVVALVGGKDFHGGRPWSKFNLATQGRRPAGSAFKPFALVAALRAGASRAGLLPGPATRTFELPDGPWKVSNYGKSAHALISIEEATVHSVNTAYADLVLRTGPDDVVDSARRMGVRSPLQPYPSAVLGTNEVSPLDMATAYATLAGEGVRPPTHLVERVVDRDGNVLYRMGRHAVRVLDPDTAHRVDGVLRQVVERGTARRAQIGRPAAGKTGTGQAHRDAWFVGYTPRLAAAVWVGFPDAARSMEPPATPIHVTGGSWPAMIWSAFMREALAPLPPAPFPPTPPPRPIPPPPSAVGHDQGDQRGGTCPDGSTDRRSTTRSSTTACATTG